MSSSSTSEGLWRRLLDEKAASMAQVCKIPPTINSENSFRIYFEIFCRERRQILYTQLLVKIRFGSINSFATAVDSVLGHTPPYSLAALVSGGVYMAINVRSTSSYDREFSANLIPVRLRS